LGKLEVSVAIVVTGAIEERSTGSEAFATIASSLGCPPALLVATAEGNEEEPRDSAAVLDNVELGPRGGATSTGVDSEVEEAAAAAARECLEANELPLA